jgi:putative FmdB family regulatory protein
MPMYEYVCGSCGKKTEVIQRIGEKPLKVCPYCSGKLKKAISAPAIQFKGSGWYVTDYARAKKEEKAGSDKKESAGGKTESAGEKTESAGEKTESAGKSEKVEKKAEKKDGES